MLPKLQGNALAGWLLLGGAGLVVTLTLTSLPWFGQGALPAPQTGDLLGLIQGLGTTTDSMLANTKALHTQVQAVEGKLGQLHEQEAILQKQTETGQNLMRELKKQEELTATGVSLMEQILQREEISADLTSNVHGQVQQLTQEVGKNANVLQKIAGSLQVSGSESKLLNSQMDQLLAELQKSQDSFRLFGKLKGLLQQPLGTIENLLKNDLGNSILNGTPPVTSGIPSVTNGILPEQNGQTGGLLGGVLP